MSSLPRIEASTPRATLPESVGSASGAIAPGSEFAEVMRSVFSPVHASPFRPHLSVPSVSARTQSSQSQPSSGKYPSLDGENASSDVASKPAQANQVQSSDSSAEGANGAGGNPSTSSTMSSQDSVQGGDGSTPTQGQTIGHAQSAEIAARFSAATAKGNSGSAARMTNLSVATDGKVSPSASSANTNGVAGAMVSPAVATNTQAAQAFGSTPAGTNTAGDAAGTSKTPGKPATGQPLVAASVKAAESLKKDRFLLDEVGIPSGGTANLLNPAAAQQVQAAHAEWGNGTTESANLSSGSNQDIGSGGSANASQSAGSAGDSSAKNSASDSVGSSDASATGAQGATAGNNVSSAGTGNASTGNATSGNASSTHGPNNAGTSGSASALPGSDVAARTSAGASLSSMPPGTGTPHESAVGAGSPNSSSAFFVSTHSSAAGNSGIPNASSSAGGRVSSDTFAALDSAASGERGVLLHAVSHQVSVGITDPSLGWVEVRAERIAGQVTAALATNSAASHAALTSILPSMATYLQEHHSGVQQLHVETGLAGGQSGTGSQGQPPSQNDARAGAENTAVTNPVGNGWAAASQSAAPIAVVRGTSASIKDHRFSIHA